AAPSTPGHYTDLARHDDNQRLPGIVIVRPESGLFFANADHVRNEIRTHVSSARPHTVVLDAETVPFVDVTAITMLEQLADDLARDNVQLVIARDLGAVRDVLGRAGEPETLHVYATVQ